MNIILKMRMHAVYRISSLRIYFLHFLRNPGTQNVRKIWLIPLWLTHRVTQSMAKKLVVRQQSCALQKNVNPGQPSIIDLDHENKEEGAASNVFSISGKLKRKFPEYI